MDEAVKIVQQVACFRRIIAILGAMVFLACSEPQTMNDTPEESQQLCTLCHGNPPPPPHFTQNKCQNCHGSATHLNGIVEVDQPLACNACHGNDQNPAPPFSLSGETATTHLGVGAHQVHLNPEFSAPVACSNCHTVPTVVDSPGHMDNIDNRAEVTFSGLALAPSLTAAWNAPSCNATYCHGANLHNGAATNPIWTTVNGSQSRCDSCHGNPPNWHYYHWANPSSCGSCHDATLNLDKTFKNKLLHINGIIESNTPANCSSGCHS